MSHGNERGIEGNDGSVLTLSEIQQKFSPSVCPGLAGKPKVFFVQACRGSKYRNFDFYGTLLFKGVRVPISVNHDRSKSKCQI